MAVAIYRYQALLLEILISPIITWHQAAVGKITILTPRGLLFLLEMLSSYFVTKKKDLGLPAFL